MWPYDYFNQHSGLINEFLTESQGGIEKRKVFFAKWLGNDEADAAKQENKIKEFIGNNSIVIDVTSDMKPQIEDTLKYNLEAIIPRFKKGDINIGILGSIIESFIVICDITPINLDEIKKEKGIIPEFNPNVMVELGLALAWKMPDQVIVVYDKDWPFEKLTKKLPFDIQSYFVKKIDYDDIDSEDCDLKGCIQERVKLIDFNKSLIMKNIKTKLDHDSLMMLNSRNGFMFIPEYGRYDSFHYHRELSTIRHLLNLGLFRTEIFPRGSSYGYCLTDLGRIFLTKVLGTKAVLFPKVFCEFMRTSFWLAYNSEEYRESNGKTAFDNKKNEFNHEFHILWDDADNELKKILKKKNVTSSLQVIDMYMEYHRSRGGNLQDIWSNIIVPWNKEIDRLRGNNNKEFGGHEA